MIKILKFLFIFSVILNSSKVASQEKQSLSQEEYYQNFLSEKDLDKQLYFFYKIEDFIKYKTLEEWNEYLDDEKEKYNSFNNNVFVLELYRIGIYSNLKKYEFSNNLSYDLYFKSKNEIDKKYLCKLLRRMNNNFLKESKIFEMFYVNSEMLKICPEKANLSNIYSFLGQPELAIKLLKKHRTFKKDSISFKNAQSLNDFGVFYKRNNEYDSAFHYFWKSLSLLKVIKKSDTFKNETDINILTGVVKGNIGEYYLYKKDYTAARMYFLQEAKSAREHFKKGNWGFKNDYYRNMAFCYLNTNQINIGKKYIDSLDSKANTGDKYQLLATYYTKKKNLDSASFYSEKYSNFSNALNLKLNKEKNNSLLNLLEYPIKLIQKEEENFNIQRINDQKQKRNQIIILFLVIAILVILLLYYFFVKEKKQNKLIANKNEEIKKALSEKGILYSELNHRVKNNLQLIISILKMQMNRLSNDELKTTFQYSINRISTIASLHQDLLKDETISKISLNKFISTIVNDLKKVYGTLELVKFKIDIQENLFIHIEQNQALGLIVNELITNSYKHAFNTSINNEICIKVLEKENKVYFEYKDNGIGFNASKVDKSKSIGLILIQRLANQLKANATINSENGTTVHFNFVID
ncbi:sensor histidine kinase [Polaribacter dokdonensis]|uniref:histidine kinase n=1 Tax=Polaribacter dokdonensis DSW-5 TaxID=1300348 RepID=A0A0M9CI16_9FLAO|nr:sensor histidine kinase [Polaribacter dokdonensis]KOY52569.1 Two-component system sensor histidine kinase [Polaribacter dokdonensis DSW-5]SEE48123.1 Two-component sensor histidine kinase, contains HisKA and HATPase domains [Polaribacter dokdonensis DSW-5]